jgi:hypothetical protein
MTLPRAATTSIFEEPKSDQRSAISDQEFLTADCCHLTAAPRLTADRYVPTEADLESIVAVNLESFLPQGLPFADWIAERARQVALLDDDRSRWLSDRIDELAKQAHFLGAKDPATFIDRDEAMLSRNGSGRRGYRRPWLGVSVGAIGGIADWLQESRPETAATLRRHLRVLERAAGGQQ